MRNDDDWVRTDIFCDDTYMSTDILSREFHKSIQISIISFILIIGVVILRYRKRSDVYQISEIQWRRVTSVTLPSSLDNL